MAMADDRRGPGVVVLGSVHMDLIAAADRLPGPGESVGNGVFTRAAGGKGGNQACQFVLAGGAARMLTRLGDDDFGRFLLHGLEAKGVDTTLVVRDLDAPTGASTVFVADEDYCSIIAPGAAANLSEADVEAARTAIEAADALVLQLELPAAISAYAAAIAAEAGTQVIFNASPAPEGVAALPGALLGATSLLVVNRVEAGRLLGRGVESADAEAAVAALSADLGIGTVVVTLGGEGIVAIQDGIIRRQPAFAATVVDAVGAGDAFLGTFATGWLEGMPLDVALCRGAAAGALAVSRSGVYDALPDRQAVDRFLAETAAS